MDMYMHTDGDNHSLQHSDKDKLWVRFADEDSDNQVRPKAAGFGMIPWASDPVSDDEMPWKELTFGNIKDEDYYDGPTYLPPEKEVRMS